MSNLPERDLEVSRIWSPRGPLAPVELWLKILVNRSKSCGNIRQLHQELPSHSPLIPLYSLSWGDKISPSEGEQSNHRHTFENAHWRKVKKEDQSNHDHTLEKPQWRKVKKSNQTTCSPHIQFKKSVFYLSHQLIDFDVERQISCDFCHDLSM